MEIQKKFSGFHLTGNMEGCENLIELLQLLNQADNFAKRTLNISKQTESEYAVPNSNAKPKAFQKAVFQLNDNFEIIPENGKLILKLNSEYINLIVEGFQGIPKGKGDYSIGKGGMQLWFWWYLRDT